MSQPNVDRSYHQRVKEDHAEMGRHLAELRSALADQGNILRLSTLLDEFKTELAEHFELEEEDGYFSDAVAHAPRLHDDADRLLEQHRELADRLGQLCQVAKDATPDVEWESIEAQVNQFIELLIQHERAENSLILDAYGQDIGTHD